MSHRRQSSDQHYHRLLAASRAARAQALARRLIELRMEHADLDSLIDHAAVQMPVDELALRRLKKRRLLLRDQITQLEALLDPKEPA